MNHNSLSGRLVIEDEAVLDVNLNGKESYPVADARAARGVPFIFTTGFDTDSLRNGYRHFSVLQKPFPGRESGDALAELLTPKEPVASR